MITFLTELCVLYPNENIYDHPNLLEVDSKKVTICIISYDAINMVVLSLVACTM